MNKEDIILSGLLELYAMGLTSSEEAKLVEDWVSEYSDLRDDLLAIEVSLETYARANAVMPSPSVKEKIFSIINEEGKVFTGLTPVIGKHKETGVYQMPSFLRIAAAAVVALLIGSLVLAYSYYGKYQDANKELVVAQQKIAQQNEANLAMKTDMNVMSDKNSLPVVLKGTPDEPNALAKIYWMRNTGDVYVDPSNLPGVPSGKQYQLWAIVDGKPVDAGMISTTKGIYHIQKMKSFGRAEAFAITLEKSGGNTTPKGTMFVISKI